MYQLDICKLISKLANQTKEEQKARIKRKQELSEHLARLGREQTIIITAATPGNEDGGSTSNQSSSSRRQAKVLFPGKDEELCELLGLSKEDKWKLISMTDLKRVKEATEFLYSVLPLK